MHTLTIDNCPGGPFQLGGGLPLALLAGPCVLEEYERCLLIGRGIKEICSRLGLPYIFKASFDKANRSSIGGYRGPGLEKGLEMLKAIKKELRVPIVTDVHEVAQVALVAEVADVIQIPAFLCRQTDLLLAAARSSAVVNVKKGQFMAPDDMRNVVEKLRQGGCSRIMLTERGVSFGYHNLVVDMRSLPMMRSLGYPVVFDASHSVQLPGAGGACSGGNREFVPTLVRAAVAAGVDALFMEVHDNPQEALCDGPNMVYLNQLESILKDAVAIHQVVQPHLL